MKFDAQTAAFVQRVNAARQSMEAAADSSRKFGQTTAHAGDQAAQSMERAAGKIVDAMKSFIGIGGAVETASAIWTRELEWMTQKADHLAQSVGTLQDTLANRGSVAMLPAVRSHLEKLAAGKIAYADDQATGQKGILSIYSGINAQMSDRLNDKQLEQATGVAVRGVVMGMGADQATKLGTTYAELGLQARPGTSLAAMDDQQRQEIAYALHRQVPGGLDPRAWRFVSRSKDPLKALDLTIAAAHGHESGRAMEQIYLQADREIGPEEIKQWTKAARHHKLSTEDQRLLRLAKIPADQRADALIADPSLGGPTLERLVANLLKNAHPFMEDAVKGHSFEAQTAAMIQLRQSDPQMKAAYAKTMAGINAEHVTRMGAAGDLTDQAVFQQMEATMKAGGSTAFSAWTSAHTNWALHWLIGMMGGDDGGPGAKSNFASYRADLESQQRGVNAQIESKQLYDELRNQTAHLAAIAHGVHGAGGRDGVKMKRDVDGQQ